MAAGPQRVEGGRERCVRLCGVVETEADHAVAEHHVERGGRVMVAEEAHGRDGAAREGVQTLVLDQSLRSDGRV